MLYTFQRYEEKIWLIMLIKLRWRNLYSKTWPYSVYNILHISKTFRCRGLFQKKKIFGAEATYSHRTSSESIHKALQFAICTIDVSPTIIKNETCDAQCIRYHTFPRQDIIVYTGNILLTLVEDRNRLINVEIAIKKVSKYNAWHNKTVINTHTRLY